MSRIFLSHSSKDNFEAIALSDWLASEGWSDVFLDLDPERGIAAGERWERALHAAANRCQAVIFLVSGNWLASGWCLKEYALARGLNKKLFAALIDPLDNDRISPRPSYTGVWQIVDLARGQDLRLFPTSRPALMTSGTLAIPIRPSATEARIGEGRARCQFLRLAAGARTGPRALSRPEAAGSGRCGHLLRPRRAHRRGRRSS